MLDDFYKPCHSMFNIPVATFATGTDVRGAANRNTGG